MHSRSITRYALAAAALLGIMSCGSGVLDVGHPQAVGNGGGGNGASASTSNAASYDGILADSTNQGRITFSINASAVLTGTITFPGLIVPLSGTLDTVAQQVHASGGGYTFSGQPFHGTFQATYTGPAGTSTGYITATSDSLTTLAHSNYCGTYTSTNGTGWFSMVILSDGELAGFAVQKVGHASSQSFTGTLTAGTTITATTTLAAPITGALNGSTVSGSFSPPIGSTTGTGAFTSNFGSC